MVDTQKNGVVVYVVSLEKLAVLFDDVDEVFTKKRGYIYPVVGVFKEILVFESDVGIASDLCVSALCGPFEVESHLNGSLGREHVGHDDEVKTFCRASFKVLHLIHAVESSY